MEELKFKPRNITAKLLKPLNPGDKIMHTEDMGSFKIRKNGRFLIKIGRDIIRVSKIKIDKEI